MEPLYIALGSRGERLSEAELQQVEDFIRKHDGVQEPVLAQAVDSANFAEIIKPINFADAKSWPFLVVLIVSEDGTVNGYRPGGRMVEFMTTAKPGVGSYELLAKILELE